MLEEPVLKKKNRRFKKYLLFSVLGLFLFTGISYGLVYFVQEYQGSSMGLTTDVLTVNITENGSVGITGATGQKDSDGINNDKTTFTITNNSDVTINAIISIVESADSVISNTDVRFGVLENDIIKNIGNLGENNNILYEIQIEKGETKTLTSTIWLDYYYTGSGETFKGTYKVEAQNADDNAAVYLAGVLDKGKGLYAISTNGTLYANSGNIKEYRYSGTNPDNYVIFNDEMWRIVGIFNGQLKLVHNTNLSASSYGTANTFVGSSIETVLNNYYDNSLNDESKEIIVNGTFNIGGVNLNDTYSNLLTNEAVTTYNGKVGLLLASDFLYSTDTAYYTSALNSTDVSGNTWLTGTYLTMNAISGTTANVLAINANVPASVVSTTTTYAAKPCVYLRKNVYIVAGNGTENNPYVIKATVEEE